RNPSSPAIRSRRVRSTRSSWRSRRSSCAGSASGAEASGGRDRFDPEGGVASDDVEVAVAVQDGGALPDRDRRDQAVDEAADRFAAGPTRPVDGGGDLEGLEALDAKHPQGEKTASYLGDLLGRPVGSK